MNLGRPDPKRERDWREAVPYVVAAGMVVFLEAAHKVFQFFPRRLRSLVVRPVESVLNPGMVEETVAEGDSAAAAWPSSKEGGRLKVGDVVETGGGHGV